VIHVYFLKAIYVKCCFTTYNFNYSKEFNTEFELSNFTFNCKVRIITNIACVSMCIISIYDTFHDCIKLSNRKHEMQIITIESAVVR